MLGWRDEKYYASDPWRGKWSTEGGGVLVNQAPHQLDLLHWYLGPVKEVYGIWKNFNHPYIEVEDTAIATVQFSTGAMASILVSNSQKPGIYAKVHIHGSGVFQLPARDCHRRLLRLGGHENQHLCEGLHLHRVRFSLHHDLFRNGCAQIRTQFPPDGKMQDGEVLSSIPNNQRIDKAFIGDYGQRRKRFSAFQRVLDGLVFRLRD